MRECGAIPVIDKETGLDLVDSLASIPSTRVRNARRSYGPARVSRGVHVDNNRHNQRKERINMRSGKTFGIALAAAAMLLGVVAMSAFGAPEIKLTKGATYPQAILGSSSETSVLELASGTKVECTSLTNTGSLNSPTDLLLLLIWHHCTEPALKAPCKTVGEPEGLIHVTQLVLPVLLLTHLPGLLFELDLATGQKHSAEFECDGVKITVNGTVLGHIISPAINTPSSELTVDVNVATPGHAQTFTHAEGSESIDLLESTNLSGVFEMSTESVINDKSHFEKAGVEAEFTG
jgi:hypothetical protein